MHSRLILACALAACVLSGCTTENPRPMGSISDGTFYQVIGKPPLNQLPLPDCRVQ